MARRSGSVAAAVTNSLPDSDQLSLDKPEDATGADFSEQLLTPENSRSETSSNNEHALGEDMTTLQQPSRRVTRSSLRGIDKFNGPNVGNQPDVVDSSLDMTSRPGSGGTLVNNVAECNTSRSPLARHSMAVMETSSRSEATLTGDGAEMDSSAVPRGSPVTKDFKEPQQADSGPPLRERASRERHSSRAPTKEKEVKAVSKKVKTDNGKTLRRSSRLSLMEKATKLRETADSTSGKRPKDMLEKGKELGRRASLRPRNAILPKDRSAIGEAPREAPPAKKRRVSESDLPSKSVSRPSSAQEESPAPNPVSRYKPKHWLTHGLYVGQDRPTDSRLNEAKNKIKGSERKSSGESQRKLLPMPMFAGERLLQNGRDFKLPFDIFSPLPPRQPKPNEWRKTNKSKYFYFTFFCG